MLVDLHPTPLREPEPSSSALLAWHELAFLWNSGDLAAAHDWLNERWAALVRNRPGGEADPEARFLQAIAFAVLALHFAESGNDEGARLTLDDGRLALAAFRPEFLGVRVDPILATLATLDEALRAIAPDGAAPRAPVPRARFELSGRGP